MRQAKRQNAHKAKVSQVASVPAPIGGWDAISALANMPPENAVILNNFICRPGYVEVRRGNVPQVTGFAAPVQSLMIYRGSPTGDKILAAAGGNIYDASAQGAPLGAPLYGGATIANWQYVNFAALAGTPVLIACNGTDEPISYNGAAITNPGYTGSSGGYALNQNNLLSVCMYAQRLFFIEKGTLHCWYAASEAIAGALTLFDLSSVFNKGGRLIACATWSIIYATGAITQNIVFLTDQGQVAVYSGTDPNQAADWALQGVYDLGLPMGPRALVNYGSDLIVITADGAVPISQAVRLDRSQDDLVAVTQKIQNAFSQATRAYRGNFGWEAILYSGGAETSNGNLQEGGGSLIMVNVPTANLQTSVQFVQNVQTGAWSQFLGLNAFCWALANEMIYFGGATGVYQWDIGADDNGELITAEMKMAFNACGAKGQNKEFTMIRPLLYCSGLIEPALSIDVDYQNTTPTSVPSVIDAGATTPEMRYDWTSSGAIGFVGAPHLLLTIGGDVTPYLLGDGAGDIIAVGDGNDLATQADLPFDVPVQVIGFDILYQPGGVL